MGTVAEAGTVGGSCCLRQGMGGSRGAASWLMLSTSAFPGGVASWRGGTLSSEARRVWAPCLSWEPLLNTDQGSGSDFLQGRREECSIIADLRSAAGPSRSPSCLQREVDG